MVVLSGRITVARSRKVIRRRRILAGTLAALITVGVAADDTQTAQSSARKAYVLGIFPHLATARLEEIFAPIAADLSRAVGRRVLLRTRSSFAGFSEELGREKYDIALVQPFEYVMIRERYGMVPLARRGSPLSAVIMVNSDAPYHELADLKGRVLALPPEVAAVSHLAKTALLHAGLVPGRDIRLRFLRSHDACLQQLMIERADACATADYPVRFFQDKMHILFRQLARTPKIPHVLFVAHPRVSAADREAIRQAILSWPEREEGRKIMANGRLQPFKLATDAEYDVVREYWDQLQARAD